MSHCGGTCGYVARKDDPSNWHGEEPDDWQLDREPPVGLDQEVWRCPHDALDERKYCAFHTEPENLPAEVDEGELFIEAINEAGASDDEEVARRKKQFIGATFGPFDIEGATLDAGDNHRIRLDHAAFTQEIRADRAVVKHSLAAHGVCFETDEVHSKEIRTVSFENVEFSGDVDISFWRADFNGDGAISFNGAEFSGDSGVSFGRAEFGGDGDISFNKAEFSGSGTITFERAEFSGNGDVSFEYATFYGPDVSFERAEFSGSGTISFEGAEFSGNGDVSFKLATFYGSDVTFERAEVSGDGDISFANTEFAGSDVSFTAVELSGDGYLSFGAATFGEYGNLWFNHATFNQHRDLSFAGAEFREDNDYWGDKLSFRSAEFYGDVLFRNARFSGSRDVMFDDVEFNGDGVISFEFAEFSGDGKFHFFDTEFDGPYDIIFEHAEFDVDTRFSFRYTEFNGNGNLSFTNSKFTGSIIIEFKNAEFRNYGQLSFAGTEFSGDGNILFDEVGFSGDGDLVLDKMEFSGGGDITFSDVNLNGARNLSFAGATISGDSSLSFKRVEFSRAGNLSFENAEIDRECRFRDSFFGLETEVIFSGAELSEVLFEQTADESVGYIQGHFDFSDTVFHDGLHFRSSGQRAVKKQQNSDDGPRFGLVFVGAVVFNGASFETPPNFSTMRFPADTDFTDATLRNADFQSADVTGTDEISVASFDGADLSGANFEGANLRGASFERALLSRVELLGADLTRTKLYGALLGDARINRESTFWLRADAPDRVPDHARFPVRTLRLVKTKLRRYSHRAGSEPYCVYDPRYRGADGEPDLERAAETYGTLETVARQNSLPGLASECFLGRKDVQLKQYWRDRNWLMVLRSAVPTVVARYGESPTRVLGTGAVTILVCALLYSAFGLIEHGDTGETATLFESFYFSALTFTTLGYGDFNPVTAAGRMLAVVETSIGVVILAILVFVFGRRATR